MRQRKRGKRMIEIKKFQSSLMEDIASEICDQYCKYPDTWDEDKEGQSMIDAICNHCPLVIGGKYEEG